LSSRAALLPILLAVLPSCTSAREGWARSGRYFVLSESPSLQIRRGRQVRDPQSGEILLPWVGARTPEGQPELVGCELTVYDDRDGDGTPSPGEVLIRRESHESTRKLLFADVRGSGQTPRARLVASTARERCEVGWRLAPD
jgi:hypothetical protein